MFFKNLILYRFTEPFGLSISQLNEKLEQSAFMSCPKSESFSVGWISPYGQDSNVFVHALPGNFLFAFCKEEKILPSTVIKEELEKKIALIQSSEDRIVYRKEKNELREQITINLRHQAFSRKKVTLAYINLEHDFLLIDSSSRTKAEELTSFLRKTLGSLKLALPETKTQPEVMMTSWLLNKVDLPYFSIAHNCDMLDPRQKTAMIKCKEQDLNAQEIISHLQSGKQIVKLAMNWQDKITFEFNDDLSIKKIKFLDLIQKQRDERKPNSNQEQLDADFAIMTGEFSQFLPELWSLFDGLSPLEQQ